MSDYTPTTEEVKKWFAGAVDEYRCDTGLSYEEAEQGFNRWLAGFRVEATRFLERMVQELEAENARLQQELALAETRLAEAEASHERGRPLMLIETIEELNALPDGAVVTDHMGDAHYKDRGWFFECGYHSPDVRLSHEMVRDIGGAFTVIFTRRYDDTDVERAAEAIRTFDIGQLSHHEIHMGLARAALNTLIADGADNE